MQPQDTLRPCGVAKWSLPGAPCHGSHAATPLSILSPSLTHLLPAHPPRPEGLEGSCAFGVRASQTEHERGLEEGEGRETHIPS